MGKVIRGIGLALLAAAIGTGVPGRASATAVVETGTTFVLSGSFDNGATLGGTLEINTTSGSVISSDAMVTQGSNTTSFTDIVSYGPAGPSTYEIVLQTPPVLSDPSMTLYLNNTTTLLGYTGSSLGSTSSSMDGNISFYSDPHQLTQGNLDPVPEPSMVPLVILAATAGLVARARRRRG